MTPARRDRVNDAFAQEASPIHPGLLLDRGLAQSGKAQGTKNPRQDMLRRAADSRPNDLYRLAYARWETALRRRSDADVDFMEVQGGLIVGLGSASVLEAGITLQRTYGMPVIPGSALKGLARHYAEQVLARSGSALAAGLAVGGDTHAVLFGHQKSAAYVTYYDAWYVPGSAPNDCPLCQDVITVHHPHYYTGAEGKRRAPWDFDDPNPVGFVSARGRFLVAVEAPDPAWSRFALELLRRALADYGAGGKTSSGYGRLTTQRQARDTSAEGVVAAQATPAATPAPSTKEPEAPKYKRKQSVDATVLRVKDRQLTVRLHTHHKEELPVGISVVQRINNPEWMQVDATIQVRIDAVDREGHRILGIKIS